ncbi:MAG: CRISPR-associated protein Csx19 [Acidobacteria bacterium]|nr:CRISPR-associated protein Csx19 [Acidobacteriota bacterium]
MMKDLAKPVAGLETFAADPGAWLVAQARKGLRFLLAHAVDGVIWGQVTNGRLALAGDVFKEIETPLNAETLQQARLFGPAGELFLWQTPAGITARLIEDGEATPVNSIADHQWLWGTVGDRGREEQGFSLLFDGRQGLLHAPPITGLGKNDRVVLTLRHYVDYAPDGQAYIAGSRLTGLTVERRRA